jgi:glycosyltransferase involved in cell wall biosynthesis
MLYKHGHDVTLVLNLHREGPLAGPSVASLRALRENAVADGLKVQIIAILDRPDTATREIVRSAGQLFDSVEEVDYGDLGLSRNHGASSAAGKYTAFLDADDLWGSNWITDAYRAQRPHKHGIIWHPEYLYTFDESDFDRYSATTVPDYHAGSNFIRQVGSDDPDFRWATLCVENPWSSHAFAETEVFRRFPYRPVDRAAGRGIEDFSFNLETAFMGLDHCVVPGTVHLYRKKKSASLNAQNAADGLLPYLPCDVWACFALSQRAPETETPHFSDPTGSSRSNSFGDSQ